MHNEPATWEPCAAAEPPGGLWRPPLLSSMTPGGRAARSPAPSLGLQRGGGGVWEAFPDQMSWGAGAGGWQPGRLRAGELTLHEAMSCSAPWGDLPLLHQPPSKGDIHQTSALHSG